MPITYTVEKNNSYVNAVATGILTTDEVCSYQNAVEADKSVVKGFFELFDVSRITESKIDNIGLDQIAQLVRRSNKRMKGSKLAIVLSKGTSFDRAKYYEKIAYDIHNVIVFNSREVAEAWLGVVKPINNSTV
jgi:hypothetical protein